MERKERKSFKIPKSVQFFWKGHYWTTSMEVWEKIHNTDIDMRRSQINLKDHWEIGDLFTLEEFDANVKCGGFTDYDGIGFWATSTQYNDDMAHPVMPSNFNIKNVPEWVTHILWFNK